MNILTLKKGLRLMIHVPPNSWPTEDDVIEVEVQSVGFHRKRDDRVDTSLWEVVLVPTTDSGVPGSPPGIILFAKR